jgi:hypothetical protein
MTDRTTARVVGGLFIVATVAGVLSAVLEHPATAADYLTQASSNANRVATGALMVLVMTAAVIAISIVIYPILRRFSERLALGYVVARTIEAVSFVISTIGVLTLLELSRQFVNAGNPVVSRYQTLGTTLLAGRDWTDAVLGVAAFALSALILNYALYRARLVPRWLSAWGLAGAALYLAGGVMVLFGLEPFSTIQNVLDAPLGVQEMVFAVWLIAKGFDAPAPHRPPRIFPEPRKRLPARTLANTR